MTHFKKIKMLLGCAVFSLTGCSTITTGTTQSFTVETPHADGARCVLKDTKNPESVIESTPKLVTVVKGDGPMTIRCSKVGFKDTELIVEEGFAGMTLGNVILGGGVGIIVDAASGAAQEYPVSVAVWLEPSSFANAAEQDAWKAEKAKYEAELEAKKTAAHKAKSQETN